MLIALSEYARMHDRSSDTLRRLAENGQLKTAQKIGRNWVVDSEEDYPVKKRTKSKPITIVSLFSGCGGMDLGFIGGFDFLGKTYWRTGMEIIWANELNPAACRTYRKNFGDYIVEGDICEQIKNLPSSADIVVGGFPCQDISINGKMLGVNGKRSSLYTYIVEAVKKTEPKVFVAENVKGMMTLHKGTIFKRVITSFEEAGYKTFYSLLNAADYGVPQKRERVIIVGIRKDIWEQRGDFIFPAKTNDGNWVPLSVAVPELAIKEKKYYFSERAVQGMKNAKNNMKRGLAQNLDEPCLTVTSHLAKVSLNSRDPVLLVDPKKELYRRFTPLEAARIQSFPDDFVFAGTETTAYKQIGNAIPPVLFWHITDAIVKYLGE